MKKLFIILLLFRTAQAQPVSIMMHDTAMLIPNSLAINVCVKPCNPVLQQGWQLLKGSALLSSAVSPNVIASNFSPGWVELAYFVVDNTHKRYADTLTLQMIQAPACPPAPPQRVVVGMLWQNGHWLMSYSDGTNSIL